MKLNKSLKNHMALKLDKDLKKQESRGHKLPENKVAHFYTWLELVKQASVKVEE